MPDVHLGLIGDHIAESRAPSLHRLAGQLSGLDVQYDLLIPERMGSDFAGVFARCIDLGYQGINVTYPYKETATAFVAVDDADVRALGAVNTVVFDVGGPRGFNTDFTGFVEAYRRNLAGQAPGSVCIVGAGGVGRAVAFALLRTGTHRIRLVDSDHGKADALATALRQHAVHTRIEVCESVEACVMDADGLVNCTPVGMYGHDGTPVPATGFGPASWAFDAVYTPVETQFLADASAAGLKILSGYELFFYQGIQAFEIFTGRRVDEEALRAALRTASTTA